MDWSHLPAASADAAGVKAVSKSNIVSARRGMFSLLPGTPVRSVHTDRIASHKPGFGRHLQNERRM